jgi:hypothetical protein
MWKPNGNKTGKDQHHPQVVWKQKMYKEEDRQEKGTDIIIAQGLVTTTYKERKKGPLNGYI